jgi:phenylpyruvate tautomerase PptA (4-oxalocrotonate tautomerase family)
MLMTVIVVRSPEQRLTAEHRRVLARQLTDAVLEVECGIVTDAARIGFQVHFHDLAPTHMAIAGRLLSDQPVDAMLIDIAVMDGAWPRSDREAVIANVLHALGDTLGVEPSASWWVNFRVIDEGSWGAGRAVVSMVDLLIPGLFSDERISAIRAALAPS